MYYRKTLACLPGINSVCVCVCVCVCNYIIWHQHISFLLPALSGAAPLIPFNLPPAQVAPTRLSKVQSEKQADRLRTKVQLDERDARFLSAVCARLLGIARRARAWQQEHADKWTGESCHGPSWEAHGFPEPLLISAKASIKYKQFVKMPSEFVFDLHVLCTCSKLKRRPTIRLFIPSKIKWERIQWL